MNYMSNIHLSTEQLGKTWYQLLHFSDIMVIGYFLVKIIYAYLILKLWRNFLLINFSMTFEKALATPWLLTDKPIVFLKRYTELRI